MRLLLLVLLLVPQLGAAQIYKSTDEHGNVSYSDTPPKSGPSEQVKLRQTNSTPAPEIQEPPPPVAGNAAPENVAATNYSVAIASPGNESTIPMGPGNFTVTAEVNPSLQPGALLQLYIDGAPSGDPQAAASWSLTHVYRGAHDLTVAVVDSKGKRLAESDPVRVYVLRPSVNLSIQQP